MLLVSCTKTSVAPQKHEIENQTLEGKPKTEASVQDKSYSPDIKVGTASYDKSIQPLEKFIFNTDDLLNPKTSHSVETRERLAQLNHAILELRSKNDVPLAQNKVLEKYETTLLFSCTGSNHACPSIEILRQDPLSVQVAILLVEDKKSLPDYYHLLFLAFELKNPESIPQLLTLYLKRSFELIDFIKRNPKDSLATQNQSFLSIVLSDPNLNGGPELASILKAFSPWQYSLSNSSAPLDREIFVANIRSGLYDESKELSKEFVSAVNEIQGQEDSFDRRQKDFFKKNPQITINFQLKKLLKKNEYFYLIDRLYNGNIGLTEAYVFWDHTHQDYADFSDSIKKYIQIEFLEKVLWSNQKMSQVVKEVDGVANSDLYSRVMSQSNDISLVLKKFCAKALILSQLTSYILSKNGKVSDDNSLYLMAAPKNVYLYVVLPHMMMLSHYMYKRGFKRTADFAFGTQEIDGSVITQSLYHGSQLPWFDYWSVEKATMAPGSVANVTSQELFYAFDIALNSMTFESFDIDAGEYLFDLFTQLFGGLTRIVENDLVNLQTHFAADNEWKSVLGLCEGVDSGKGFYHTIDAGEPYANTEDSFLPSDFETGAFLGSWRTKLQSKNGFLFHNDGRTLGLDYTRVLLEPNNHMLKLYIENYKTYLAKSHAKPGNLAQLETLHTQIENLIQNHLNEVLRVSKDFTHCFFTLFNREIDEQDKILANHIAILKSVYADMAVLRKDPSKKAELNQKYQFLDLGPNSMGTIRFDENSFHSLVLDFAIEAKRYYESSKDPVENTTIVSIPPNLTRLKDFRKPKEVEVLFSDSESDFIAAGLGGMINPVKETMSHYKWFESQFIFTRYFNYFLRDMVSLKRMDATRDLLSMNDLFQLPMQIRDLLMLRPADVEILKAARKTSRFPLQALTDYFNFSDEKPISYFDYILYMSSQDFLGPYMSDPYPEVGGARHGDYFGDPKDSNLIPLTTDAINFVGLKKQNIIHYFDLDLPEIDKALTTYYSSEIKSEIDLNENLKNYAVDLYKKDVAANQVKRFMIEIGKSYEVPYVSNEMIKNYDGFKYSLKQRTQDFYIH